MKPTETMHMTTPIPPNPLGFNVFTAPGKAMVGERPRPFGEALGFDPMTSTLIFGEHDVVLVDALTTVLRPRLSRIGLRSITATCGSFI